MYFFKKLHYFALAALLVFSACDDDNEGPDESADDKFVIMTATEKWDAGYFTSYNEFPNGSVQKITSQSLQIGTAFGFRSYGKWIFISSNAQSDPGIQKYSVNADGSLKNEGFISTGASPQYVIMDEMHGYYHDKNRSPLNIQMFNPTSMERTGEIDLSSLAKTEVEGKAVGYQVIGQHVLAVKERKLYAGITYGTITGGGFGDDLSSYIEMAVINTNTNTLEKTIRYEGLRGLGWGSSGNRMWTLGDDGALYFCSAGLNTGMATSAVIRIKKGETEFDKNWIVKAVDYNGPSSIATVRVKNGKLYTELASVPVLDNYSNLQDIIFDYYAIDIETKVATKITGMPQHHYCWANDQAITQINDKMYFWVRNLNEHIDGYYELNSDGTSATQVFNVAHDGFMWGFVKLN